MDGVLTDTAPLHLAAWRRVFDEYLAARTALPEEDRGSFTEQDYRRHVDGKRRTDGVLALLRSRGIEIPLGHAEDGPERNTAHGLGNRKDAYFRELVEANGVRVHADASRLLESLRACGMRTALVSASRNCEWVLRRAGLYEAFDVVVEGVRADELGLPGKPDPAIFLEAARLLEVAPSRCVLLEDAEVGARAGSTGGFGRVIGVDRTGHAEALLSAGADEVVSDLSEVSLGALGGRRDVRTLPKAASNSARIVEEIGGGPLLVALDFDGTLAPIADTPEEVRLPRRSREVLRKLARSSQVAVISGRDLSDLRARVGLPELWYGGNHGFELSAPFGDVTDRSAGKASIGDLDAIETWLRSELTTPGAVLERKRFALAVHYRDVADEDVAHLTTLVRAAVAGRETVRTTGGRRVTEIVPNVAWDKGTALNWLLERVGVGTGETGFTVLYAGDDRTDEDALRTVHAENTGIFVLSEEHREHLSWAHYVVSGPDELVDVLEHLARSRDAENV
ncbi:trehalose 6-phosphatase [Actinopolyspora mzabensis]|uniref:Trehalose 6-phosphate phosphatase n=2 Tax=Actinopolyspora mzabensis TaxID=995066 RepID=A0A1G9EKI5_ACTMZ|nr:trehalose 6-phosphatase [Actinopolyspora mzabensis]